MNLFLRVGFHIFYNRYFYDVNSIAFFCAGYYVAAVISKTNDNFEIFLCLVPVMYEILVEIKKKNSVANGLKYVQNI